ncbi:hypothetical protein GKA01_12820 [Gluconobacter kanchanaburiensis NBRC 103587]|uniref:Alkyl hydroperoxide reductase subunit C/ Thiol specific antioxidant domain-containing protein n=1 Tax=Gluconobacter kanchanaburiensis NBRC 103587 TaxID=1307948 RepID=A0A511B6J8_9PROT|nr:hypothetical protein GKA01_12820 [Gluconobacter kanchanaburiensis NBRC 103587]
MVPVAVSSGSPEKVRAFLTQSGVSGLPVWTVEDADLKAWVGTEQLAIPVTFLIDGDGRVRASASGPQDWSGAGGAEALRKIFAGMRG